MVSTWQTWLHRRGNPIFTHAKEKHEGVSNFRIKPIKTHKSAMMRKISESRAIKLYTLEKRIVLNSNSNIIGACCLN